MSSEFETAIDKLHKHLRKKGVSIFLDMDDSQLVKAGHFFSYEPKSKELRISVPELKARDKKLLLKLIQKVFDDGGLLWKESKREALIEYSDYSSGNEDQAILDFFLGVLKSNDYSALKMALFLRSQSKKNKSVDVYKVDIRERFGDRGNNIANLCSAGYFEDEFMSLYDNISNDDFWKYYEMVVGDKARALFVHRGMNLNAIEKEVEKMVAKALKYHMDDFRIHGKGVGNVAVISSFVSSRTGKENYTVTLKFKDPKIQAIEYLVKVR